MEGRGVKLEIYEKGGLLFFVIEKQKSSRGKRW